MLSALLGFLIWNYPKGLIFLGDGGAYLVGFWIAEVSVLLVIRNPEVSIFFPFLLCIYPITETIFSMFRRVVLRSVPLGVADNKHLHHMVFYRIVRLSKKNKFLKPNSYLKNASVALLIWVFSLIGIVPAVIFWDDQLMLFVFVFVFVFIYLWLYFIIIKFRIYKFLRIFSKASQS